MDYDDYKTAAMLRRELQRVGVNPSTGVYLHDSTADSNDGAVLSQDDREKILARRLANHHRLNFNIAEAKRRQRARKFWLPKQRTRMLAAQAIETASQVRTLMLAIYQAINHTDQLMILHC